MNEGKELLKRMTEARKTPWFSSNDVSIFINQHFSLTEDAKADLNGIYSIAELEAILICAYNERGQAKY